MNPPLFLLEREAPQVLSATAIICLLNTVQNPVTSAEGSDGGCEPALFIQTSTRNKQRYILGCTR